MIISDFSFDSSSSLGCLLPDVKAAAGYLPECQKGKKPGNEVVFNLSPECNYGHRHFFFENKSSHCASPMFLKNVN